MELEKEIKETIDEYGRNIYRISLQKVADETPRTGSDGKRLTEGRMQESQITTPYGKVALKLFCGRCKETGMFEVPFKIRFCRGSRCAMTPALEHRIAVTSCETGSYEKCSKVCEEWGCSISDDKSMDVVKEIGKSCKDSDLPRFCVDAAGSGCLSSSISGRSTRSARRYRGTEMNFEVCLRDYQFMICPLLMRRGCSSSRVHCWCSGRMF